MFRIRQVHDLDSPQNRNVAASVARIYQAAFSYYPQYSARIIEVLKAPTEQEFEPVLLVAEGAKNRMLGFTLSFAFPDMKLAYLDYVASDPARNARGYGTALYEATAEHFAMRRYRGLLMDVPPDVPEKLKGTKRLAVNKRRMALYERFGARPITGTAYDEIETKANQGYLTMLVFDDLDTGRGLSRQRLRNFVPRLLHIKGGMAPDDPKVKRIVASISDNPVRLREPVYARKAPGPGTMAGVETFHLVTTGDAHQIHHLREKGYVERPARVTSIRRGLSPFAPVEHKTKRHPLAAITAVHDPKLVGFLRRAETELNPGQLVYPNVFPIRRPERLPRNWEMQAGYYCIDNFTPVTAMAWAAARNAADTALTAADLIAGGEKLAYALVRPPGHHAERRAFGGFCYLNSAAIAAHRLSAEGRVAFIDIDHHHGNGSQDIFYDRNDVYFASIHGHPGTAYPYFAGYADERGAGPGRGFNRNFPLYPGADIDEYAEVLARAIRAFARFRPRFLVISLGFDIMTGDPTGSFRITERGMRRIGAMLAEPGWPTLIVQEGGYTLRNLRIGAGAFFAGFTGG